MVAPVVAVKRWKISFVDVSCRPRKARVTHVGTGQAKLPAPVVSGSVTVKRAARLGAQCVLVEWPFQIPFVSRRGPRAGGFAPAEGA